LLTHGANPMARNRDGLTPIDCAANEKTQHVFESFLRRNPSFESDQFGATPGSGRGQDRAWEAYSESEGQRSRSQSISSTPLGEIPRLRGEESHLS
jgi:hypothetical protein